MQHIKKIYLYVVSLVGLIILIVAGVTLINMGLKAWVFTKADSNIGYAPQISCAQPPSAPDTTNAKPPECSDPNYAAKQKQIETDQRAAQRQSDAAHAIAMIIVGVPVFVYHWRLARKEA